MTKHLACSRSNVTIGRGPRSAQLIGGETVGAHRLEWAAADGLR